MPITTSVRIKAITDHLTTRTRLQASQIEVLSDVRTDYGVTFESQQWVSIETQKTENAGKSGATLLSNAQMLSGAAQMEAQRLQATLPDRIKKWLVSAPTDVRNMPSTKVFDFDAANFGYDTACTPCSTSGQMPCNNCGSTGICDCGGCHGAKKTVCPQCVGQCAHICTQCHGSRTTSCEKCHGSAKTQCQSCFGSGQMGCNSCGGYGHTKRYQTVARDIGKGVFYETVEVRDACYACTGSGKISCSICYGTRQVSCNHCSGGQISCQPCSGSGRQSCNTCNAMGQITCQTCRGIGHAVCAKCRGKCSIDCGQCGATGWRHEKEKVFAKLTDKFSINFAKEIPVQLRARVNALLASVLYASEGNFQLSQQTVTEGSAPGVCRVWSGTFPVWEMLIRIGAHQFTLHAIGNSQKMDDLSSMTHTVLDADRSALTQALQSGRSADIVLPLRTYLLSADHQHELLAYLKNPTPSAREDVKGAVDFLLKRRQAALRKWRLFILAVLALGFALMLMGMHFAYDWVTVLVLPVVVLLVGGKLATASAMVSTVSATGDKKFSADFNADKHWKWRMAGLFWKGLLLGLLPLAVGFIMSPSHPFFIQKIVSEIKLKALKVGNKDDRVQSSLQVIQQWMRCEGDTEDVYTALKLLEQENLLTYFNAGAKYEQFYGQRWHSNSVELFDRSVYEIAYFPRSQQSDNLGQRLEMKIVLKTEANDPPTLIKKLGIQAIRVPSKYLQEAQRKPDEGIFKYTPPHAEWQASLSEFSGFKVFANYLKPLQLQPKTQKEIFKVPSLEVTCMRFTGDFFRTR